MICGPNLYDLRAEFVSVRVCMIPSRSKFVGPHLRRSEFTSKRFNIICQEELEANCSLLACDFRGYDKSLIFIFVHLIQSEKLSSFQEIKNQSCTRFVLRHIIDSFCQWIISLFFMSFWLHLVIRLIFLQMAESVTNYYL